uniref:armadillo-like helical domain-containing protein 4 n=1 Tax=Oncorhynchus gorbuscha TaxID=8017 RepID=UPI001EAF6028|nr:armadillo-like helical domain-containing protein 4 [Oncorhynchus gorbuscha]XP_046154769.1 armadillo-like helical domain-containing protein 4 [Oncorhynchus gorbuscha]XP_046154770.1 armadillo-like helical domain-containing protein 4 [Oncorhynchus gorbuscha]XP_046154771.1 armadillo-like helical domain-containing protein 4 [Oncorhynchus gorbuscha]
MGKMLFPATLHHLLLVGVCLCVYSTPVPPLHDYAPASQDSGCDGQAGEPMEGEACVTPATPASVTSTSVQSGPSDPGRLSYGMAEHMTGSWTDLSENVGAGGGTGPDVMGRKPGGIEPVMQARNVDSHEGISGPGGAKSHGREAETGVASESFSEGKETHRLPVEAPELYTDKEMKVGPEEDPMEDVPTITTGAMIASLGERQGMTVAMKTLRVALHGASTAARAPEPDSQTGMHLAGDRRDIILEERPDLQGGKEGELRESLPDLGAPLLGQETDSPLTSIPPSVWRSSRDASSLPPSSLEAAGPASPHPQDGATAFALPDPLLPDLGPALTGSSRQDDPDSLWTEPLQQNGAVDASAPPLQDASTEGTMSSEDLPLIFEPFDDVTPEGAGVATAVLAAGNSQLSVSMSTTGMLLSEVEFDQVDTGDTGPSRVPPLVLPDWTSPWQTSGAEISEPICPSGPPIDPHPSETEQPGGSETIQNPEETPPTSEPNPTSIASQQINMTTVTKTTNLPVVKSGLEELESEEEPEVDENTEESEDSEEEQKETPIPAPTRPPYSLIPPPPVWVQRNQGLMRSWVELIREKAGYVSGMLAPVGIGIMGALLIVGALYSIRMIHRKRRNSFKHQRRRKARHTEQPREPSSNGQDQAMLLADSSEDEF